MGMEDIPFYKRLLDDLAKPRPDLSYKFKSASESAKPADTPSVVMQGSPDSSPVDIAYTDKAEIPGRPTFPFEVRVMANEDGVLTSIRCYKGKIYDPRTGQTSSSFKGLLVQGITSRKRITLHGNRGNVSGDQKDFTPSNYDPGPDQFKYSEYNDPIQTTWLPNYEGVATNGVKNAGKDSDPIETTATFATGSFPVAKDSFTSSDSGAYFEWPYVDGAMIRLFCYDDGYPANRKWGIWGNSGLPANIGSQGFFIFLAQVNGSQVMQMFRSDIVALGGSPAVAAHPFKVTSVDGNITVAAGTVNNIILDESYHEGGGTTYVYIRWQYDADTDEPLSDPEVGTYATIHASDDENFYLLVAEVIGDTVNQFVTGSLWVDRMRMGDQAANYYVARI